MTNPYNVPIMLDIANAIYIVGMQLDDEGTKIVKRHKGKHSEIDEVLSTLNQADMALRQALRMLTKAINQVVVQI